LWEFGHVAWFQERWVLRHLCGQPPLWDRADGLYDSTAIAHARRWHLPLPPRQQTLDYMQRVLDRVLDSLGPNQPEEQERYFHLLTLFHEDMHDEAFVYTRQTLGYPSPPGVPDPPPGGKPCFDDVEIPGGTHWLGSSKETGFVFDNEKWAHLRRGRRLPAARTVEPGGLGLASAGRGATAALLGARRVTLAAAQL
jgi:iron(II)-dependent oxidoreductase